MRGQIGGENGGGQVKDRTTPWPFSFTFVALFEIDIFLRVFFRFYHRHFQFFHPPTASLALSLFLAFFCFVFLWMGCFVLDVFIWPTLKLVDWI